MRWICLTTFLLIPVFAQSEKDLRAGTPPPPNVSLPAAAPAPVLTVEQRGDIFMARKNYREAIDTYNSISPPTALILNKVGIAYHQMGELDAARKQYEKALKLNKQYSEAINNLGTVYYGKRNYRKAISYYKKAIKLAPNSASMHSNLGTAWFARKKYKEAAASYETALLLDPMVFERRGTSGSLLQERNIEERAKFHFYLSKTYAKVGMVDLAIQNMRKAIEGGFKDRERFLKDDEFASIRTHPDFEILMKMESRVL